MMWAPVKQGIMVTSSWSSSLEEEARGTLCCGRNGPRVCSRTNLSGALQYWAIFKPAESSDHSLFSDSTNPMPTVILTTDYSGRRAQTLSNTGQRDREEDHGNLRHQTCCLPNTATADTKEPFKLSFRTSQSVIVSLTTYARPAMQLHRCLHSSPHDISRLCKVLCNKNQTPKCKITATCLPCHPDTTSNRSPPPTPWSRSHSPDS